MSGLRRSRFMRLPEVVQLTGVSRSTIYRWMAHGEFPKQVSLGANTVAWLENEIDTRIKQMFGSDRHGLDCSTYSFDYWKRFVAAASAHVACKII